MKPIIFFTAEKYIYSFSRIPAIFAHALSKVDQKNFVIECSGELSRCAVLGMLNCAPNISIKDKQKICDDCKRKGERIANTYKYDQLPLSLHFSKKDQQHAFEQASLLLQNNPITTKYEGIPVGLLAYKSVALETKDASFTLTDVQKKLFFEHLKTAIETCIITKNIIENHNPQAFFYGQYYCPELASDLVCKQSGVATTFQSTVILNGHDHGRLNFFAPPILPNIKQITKNWPIAKDIAISCEDVSSCFDDVYSRNYGNDAHIYSPKKALTSADLISKLNLDPTLKTLVMFSSSQDERTALEAICSLYNTQSKIEDVFPDQTILLRELCSFIEKSPDIQLIIRLHPRLGKDKRTHMVSPHLQDFVEVLTSLPKRCHVIWPDEEISSYDLAELADLVLVSWSTMGRELARIGIPVIAATSNFYYPNEDFIQTPTSKQKYFEAISKTLVSDYSFSMVQKAIRFHHYCAEVPLLDLRNELGSDLPTLDQESTPVNLSSAKIQLIRDIATGTIDYTSFAIDNFLHANHAKSVIDEETSIVKELCLFIHTSFYPPTKPQPQLNVITLFRSFIKYILPESLTHIIKKMLKKFICNKSKTIPIHQQGKKTIRQYPPFSFTLYTEYPMTDELVKKSLADPLLCYIIRNTLEIIYIHNGVLKSRANSKLLHRIFNLVYEKKDLLR